MTPLAPAIALSMHGWDILVRTFRPRTSQEHLQEQTKLHRQKEHQLSKTATEKAKHVPDTQQDTLVLGVFIKFVQKNDSFPEWLGIDKKRSG